MSLSEQQISSLLGLVAQTEEDKIDCDTCFNDIAQFAEANLAGAEVPEALKLVERHLQQCPCCKDEFQALRNALATMEAED